MNQTTLTRQIVLDTETTGINQGIGAPYEGHKIIEIGGVEIINRRLTGRHFHTYVKPDRLVDPEAFAIHGISDEFLADKPQFKDIAEDFIKFIEGAELIIHNAPFDVGFINYEYRTLKSSFIVQQHCDITDSLQIARRLFPGKRNSLDALCDRFQIDNSHRTLHGALLDAEILADVYLIMTGGQVSLTFSDPETSHYNNAENQTEVMTHQVIQTPQYLKVISASTDEIAAHNEVLDRVDGKSGQSLWRKITSLTH